LYYVTAEKFSVVLSAMLDGGAWR